MGKASLDRFLKPCPSGTVLFQEGEPGDRMLVIQAGRGQIVKMTVHELAEATGLAEDEVHRVVRRVLSNRLPGGGGGLVDSYQQFLALKRRFEYPERC